MSHQQKYSKQQQQTYTKVNQSVEEESPLHFYETFAMGGQAVGFPAETVVLRGVPVMVKEVFQARQFDTFQAQPATLVQLLNPSDRELLIRLVECLLDWSRKRFQGMEVEAKTIVDEEGVTRLKDPQPAQYILGNHYKADIKATPWVRREGDVMIVGVSLRLNRITV